MTGVRIYDPARSGRVYVHTDPTTGLLPAPRPITRPASIAAASVERTAR